MPLFFQHVTTICRAWYHTRWAFIVSLTLNLLFIAPFALVWFGMSPEVSRVAYFVEMAVLIIIAIEVIMLVRGTYTQKSKVDATTNFR